MPEPGPARDDDEDDLETRLSGAGAPSSPGRPHEEEEETLASAASRETRDTEAPTGVMLDPYYPNQFLFACVAGEGRFAGMDPLRIGAQQSIAVPGIRRIFSCSSH